MRSYSGWVRGIGASVVTAALMAVPGVAAAAPAPAPVAAAAAAAAAATVEPPPVAPLPAAKPVEPKVEREALVAPAPSPDSANAAQASSPDPLKLVAVSWTGPTPDLIELRSRLATGAFGPWTRVDPVDTERDGVRAKVASSEPVWVADSREVQVRAVDDGAPATARMALTSIDPATSTNDTAARAASVSPGLPKLVTRAQWGADEKLMTWPPQYTPTVRAVTIHHTAGTNAYSAAESAAIVRGIYAYHAKTLGWGDIGYNVLVDRFGTVFEGRKGGLDRSVIAAHAGGFNRETFGIGMMGDFTSVAPPAAQIESTARLAAYKLGGLYRDPRATVSLTSTGGGTSRYPAGRAVTLPTVFAHRDVGSTECPGNTGIRSMPAIRDRTAALVGDLATNPVRTKWLAMRGLLGEPSVVEAATGQGARVTRFSGANGSVYWSAATGAWSVIGEINKRYDAIRAASSAVGLPRTDELTTPDRRGRYNQFATGLVYWTPQTGAWPVRGAILDAWAKAGYERSAYGYPRSDEYAVSGGIRQDFERGSLFYDTRTAAVRRA